MTAAKAIDSPYAWFRLAVSLLLATIGGIGLWAPVLFLPAVQQEFGIDRAGASFPYTMTMIGFGLGGLLMGRLTDRYGITRPMLVSTLFLGAGFVAASQATSYVAFLAIQSIMIGLLGCAVTFGPLVADISLWFRRWRGVAVAIGASGNYLAGTIWPRTLTSFTASHGWRETLFWIGIVCVLTMLPLAFLLRRRASTQDAVGGDAANLARPAPVQDGTPVMQVMLVVAGLACCVAMSMPQVHIIAYCGDLGYGTAVGAQMLSIMLGFGVVSRLVSGLLADRIGGAGTLVIGSVLQCLALAFYVPFDGLTSLYVVSALFGLAQGGIVPSYALIIRDHFPAREAGFRISLVLAATVIGMALGGWISGEIFDYTGSYTMAFVHGIIWNLLNMAIALWLLLRGRTPASQAVPA